MEAINNFYITHVYFMCIEHFFTILVYLIHSLDSLNKYKKMIKYTVTV